MKINNSEEIVNTMSYYVLDLSNTLTALALFSGTINTWKLERFIYFERIILNITLLRDSLIKLLFREKIKILVHFIYLHDSN